MMQHHLATCRIFAAIAAGELIQLATALLRHGPSWETVPPLLLALAALIGAMRNYLDGAQARRIALDEHRMKLGCCRKLFDGAGGIERLN